MEGLGKETSGRMVGDHLGSANAPLYSKKLHIRVLRASTSWETSLMILALSFGESVVNHFASRCVHDGQLLVRYTQVDDATYHFTLPREQNEVSTCH